MGSFVKPYAHGSLLDSRFYRQTPLTDKAYLIYKGIQ